MSLHVAGDWPNPLERLQIMTALRWLLDKPEPWEVALITGQEQVLTLDPAYPLQVQPKAALKVMTPATMKVRPRYLIRRLDADWLAFSACGIFELVAMLVIYYDIGEDGIKELIASAMPPVTLSA